MQVTPAYSIFAQTKGEWMFNDVQSTKNRHTEELRSSHWINFSLIKSWLPIRFLQWLQVWGCYMPMQVISFLHNGGLFCSLSCVPCVQVLVESVETHCCAMDFRHLLRKSEVPKSILGKLSREQAHLKNFVAFFFCYVRNYSPKAIIYNNRIILHNLFCMKDSGTLLVFSNFLCY